MNNDSAPSVKPEDKKVTDSASEAVRDKNQKLMYKLAAFAVMMLLFGVLVLPWFYNLACSLTGVNLNPNNKVKIGLPSDGSTADMITVSFQARVLDNLPIRFYAKDERATIQAGATAFNTFYFENLSNEIVYLRPMHTVSPSFAASAFDMKVCFCFNDQALEPGEKKEYEIQYSFGADMDKRVDRAIVRYDLHKIDQTQMKPFQLGPDALDPAKVDEIIRGKSE